MHRPDFSPEQQPNLIQRVTGTAVGRLVLLGVAVTLALSALTTITLAQGGGPEYELRVSSNADRSDATDLDGENLSGEVFIFLTPEKGVDHVRFFLDDPDMEGDPFTVEHYVPYDFAGTDEPNDYTAYVFDVDGLEDGEHTVTARVKTEKGDRVTTSATFTVGKRADSDGGDGSGVDGAYTLLVSEHRDRSFAERLDGTAQDGEIFVFIKPEDGVKQVRFFLDDPDMEGKPYSVEDFIPYDFAGTDEPNDYTAYVFDTGDLEEDGAHTITALVKTEDGDNQVVSATFTVGMTAEDADTVGSSEDSEEPTPSPTESGDADGDGDRADEDEASDEGDESDSEDGEDVSDEQGDSNVGAGPGSGNTGSPRIGTGSMPSGAVEVNPGDDIQSLVDSNSSGSTFYLTAGVHRMQSVRPKDGNTFLGADGAVMRGSRELTSWDRSDSLWVTNGQRQEGNATGRCENGDICQRPEQLFIDGERLEQVSRRGDVSSGQWYFDYGSDRIYIADDPNGRLVETSVTDHAFSGSADNVTIRGLVIEQYATPAQRGAIQGKDGDNWVVDGNLVQYNHGGGIRTGDGMQVTNNQVLYQGQLGITGGGTDVLVEGNEIAYNNLSGYLPQWEAGGTKFVKTRNLVVRDNYVHDNVGPGLWTDIDNIDTLFEANTVEENTEQGIKHEISYAAIIRDNVVRYNGFGYDTWLWGGQIVIQDSSDTEVYNNTVVVGEKGDGITGVDQGRGDGAHGPWTLRNLWVHDNDITYERSGANSGVAGACGDNNRFDRNTYRAPGSYESRSDWEWCGVQTFESLQGKGQEQNGRLITD